MKIGSRILIGIGCAALLLVSWIVAITAPTNGERQLSLINQAAALMEDKIYVTAVPLLEEAIGYNGEYTLEAEMLLKQAYLKLIDQQGYQRKYISLLESQMNRNDTASEIFLEAANFYLERSKLSDALTVLKTGIEKTGSEELTALYESNRYAYQMGYTMYEDVTSIYNDTIAVQVDGLWGLAKADGTLMIACQYDQISTYNNNRAIAREGEEIIAVDSSGNRIALLKEPASDFGNYADNRVSILINNVWRRATGDFEIGSASFEELGTYSDGYIAAKQNGKWGVVNLQNEWLLPPEYDAIIMDELGRAYGQGAVFAKTGDAVYLFVGSAKIGGPYDDAKPFGEEGYAAVKKDGEWGFIDTSGALKIPYQFDDALSFGQHLAAVKTGEFWSYISLSGETVIDAGFLLAKSFSNGSAPVLTNRGWQFITLLEYKEGVGL